MCVLLLQCNTLCNKKLKTYKLEKWDLQKKCNLQKKKLKIFHFTQYL